MIDLILSPTPINGLEHRWNDQHRSERRKTFLPQRFSLFVQVKWNWKSKNKTKAIEVARAIVLIDTVDRSEWEDSILLAWKRRKRNRHWFSSIWKRTKANGRAKKSSICAEKEEIILISDQRQKGGTILICAEKRKTERKRRKNRQQQQRQC